MIFQARIGRRDTRDDRKKREREYEIGTRDIFPDRFGKFLKHFNLISANTSTSAIDLEFPTGIPT